MHQTRGLTGMTPVAQPLRAWGLATLLTEPAGSSSSPLKLQATVSYNVPNVFRNFRPLN